MHQESVYTECLECVVLDAAAGVHAVDDAHDEQVEELQRERHQVELVGGV